MNYRIEISPLPRWRDARGEGVKQQVKDSLGIALDGVRTRDVYTVSADISADEAAKLAELLYNPVLQCWSAGGRRSANYQSPEAPAFVLVVGYLKSFSIFEVISDAVPWMISPLTPL